MSTSSSSTSIMGSRKRKVRDDDQLDEDLKWQDAKRQAVKVEDVWTSSSEGLGDINGSELDHEEVLLEGLSLGKDSVEEEGGEIALTSEDPSSLESEADKENTDGGLSSLGSPSTDAAGTSCKISPSENELPPPLSAWLLTPPSLNTQRKSFKLMSSETQFEPSQGSPLPPGLGWADPTEVWDIMINKDKLWGSYRDADLFSKHPSLEPRMRAILLDWLIEVCEVYKLHRETYYLGQDFIDRFLSAQKDVPKQQLQLIGITCLFIAAKVEEIYPPKICEFAYVTDGACDESEILEKELIILKALNWDLSPVTVNSWLTIYLQLYGRDGFDTKEDCEDDERDVEGESSEEIQNSRGTRRPEYLTTIRRARRRRGRRRIYLPNPASVTLNPPSGDTFVFPQFPGIALARAAQLADFATLDSQSLRFPYSIIAASTLYHVWSKDVALTVSGLSFADIKPCVDWMSAFAITLKESGCTSQLSKQLEAVWARLGLGTSVGDTGTRGSALLRTIPRLVVDDSHNIQTHLVDLDLLEKAQERLSSMSPELVMTPPLVLTLSTSSSPTSRRDTNASSPASLALLTPPASGVKSFSATSSVGNVNVTPSMTASSYNSGDFCVG